MSEYKIIAVFLLLLAVGLSISTVPSNAQNQEQYQLRCSIGFTPSTPHQTETITVSISIENLGYEPFNGTAILNVKNEYGEYEAKVFPINNLVKGDIQNNSNSYRADDEGTYWATLKLESLSFFDLYVGSELIHDNVVRADYTNSIYVMSLSDYNQQESNKTNIFIAFLTTISVAIALFTAIKMTQRKRSRRR